MKLGDRLFPDIATVGKERTLKSGEPLFRTGQRPVGLFEILTGRLRLVRIDRTGRETALYTAGAGETIAEASLFSRSYHCDAVAATKAKVCLYPKEAIFAHFRRDPEAAQKFMARLAIQLMDVRTRLERRGIQSARERLRHYLSANAEVDGRTVILRGTVKELAAEIGLTHEVAYRTLAAMVSDGEIKRTKGEIKLMRPM